MDLKLAAAAAAAGAFVPWPMPPPKTRCQSKISKLEECSELKGHFL